MASRTEGQSERRVADGSTGRVLALAALILFTAVALRGYLPGAEPSPREPDADNPLALVVVIGLVFAAVAIVVVAVIVRARQRTPAPAAAGSRPDWLRGDVGRPTWRVVLIAFVVVLALLVAAILLSRLGGGHGLNPPAFVPDPDPATSAPTPGPKPADPGAPEPSGTAPNVLDSFTVATVVFLFVLVVGTVLAMRRQSPARSPSDGEPTADSIPPAVDDGSESLARAAEFGLAEVEDLSREPRKAIIACYAAMERELARVPEAEPQDFDTASEVLARAVDHHALQPDSATQLVDLFDEARFSPHVMTEAHREVAVQVLQRVLGELAVHP